MIKNIVSFAAYIFAAMALIYVLVAVAAMIFQRRLLYIPDAARVSPREAGLTDVSEVEMKTPDGETLIVWAAPAKEGRPTLLYFHGNGGGLIDRRERIQRFTTAGYGLFMMSYRSYSGSTGAATEKANIADASLAFDTLVARGVRPSEIVIYGESLGTGVAVQTAAARKPGGVILDAPYTSMIAAAQQHYAWLPVKPFLIDTYRSDQHIANVTAPLLILHGALDGIVGADLGRKLFALANQPKDMVVFEQGNHTDLYNHGALQSVNDFVQKHIKPVGQ